MEVRIDFQVVKESAGMPYVKRDAEGQIVALYAKPGAEAAEEVDARDPALAGFLADARLTRSVLGDWLDSDLAMVRVLEDLIALLIDNGTIRFDQLPAEAQRKIVRRHGLRQDLRYVVTLFAGSDSERTGSEDADENERYL